VSSRTVYSLTKLHLKATHCHLTAKVSHAGLLKHEPSLSGSRCEVQVIELASSIDTCAEKAASTLELPMLLSAVFRCEVGRAPCFSVDEMLARNILTKLFERK